MDKNIVLKIFFVKFKIADIKALRIFLIVNRRNIYAGNRIRVIDICVHWSTVSLYLPFRRNLKIIKRKSIKIRRLIAFNHHNTVREKLKFPDTV